VGAVRKWTVAGSHAGGARTSIHTLIETAKLNDVDLQAWLADALACLQDHSAKRIAELLAWSWKRSRRKGPPRGSCSVLGAPNQRSGVPMPTSYSLRICAAWLASAYLPDSACSSCWCLSFNKRLQREGRWPDQCSLDLVLDLVPPNCGREEWLSDGRIRCRRCCAFTACSNGMVERPGDGGRTLRDRFDAAFRGPVAGARFGAGRETTILSFSHVLEGDNLSAALFEVVKKHVQEAGLLRRQGTIVDAMIIAPPSSTKNSTGKRDSQMHQTKKGISGVRGEGPYPHGCLQRAGAQRDRHGRQRRRRDAGAALLHGEEEEAFAMPAMPVTPASRSGPRPGPAWSSG